MWLRLSAAAKLEFLEQMQRKTEAQRREKDKDTSDIVKAMRHNSDYGNMESLPFLTYILSPLLMFVGVAVAVAGVCF